MGDGKKTQTELLQLSCLVGSDSGFEIDWSRENHVVAMGTRSCHSEVVVSFSRPSLRKLLAGHPRGRSPICAAYLPPEPRFCRDGCRLPGSRDCRRDGAVQHRECGTTESLP